MKICKTCNISKSYTEFHTNSTYKDGYVWTCKVCVKDKYSNNLELSRLKSRNNYHKHVDKRKSQATAWKDSNVLSVAANDGRSRALRCGAVLPDNFKLESTITFYEEARRLTEETGVLHHVDHIIPCSKGGLHCHTNLQVLTAEANIKKSNQISGEKTL
tara:strand:+ start:18 stop:494 length:477 start_codon:yes stop_codon:yes gene_type:complete